MKSFNNIIDLNFDSIPFPIVWSVIGLPVHKLQIVQLFNSAVE